jgi:hypothetical protein
MARRRKNRSTFGFMAVAVASVSAAVSLLTFGEGPAEAAPDPAAVQRYLAELEAAQPSGPAGDDERKSGRGENIRKMVEGAAVRAPSGSVINGIEAALAEKLG